VTRAGLVERRRSFALAGSVGTATNVAVIPYAKEKGTADNPRRRVVEVLRRTEHLSIASGLWLVRRLQRGVCVGELGLKRVALLWENDELGRSAKHGFDIFMQAKGIAAAESVPFEVKTHRFQPAYPPT